MSLSVCFIERRDRDSPSIERVFRSIAAELEKMGVLTSFVQLPYGNDLFSTLRNLIFFRAPHADIYHVTGHVNYMGLVLPRDKTVLTVHDLTILEFRSGLRGWLIEKLYFAWPLRRLKFLTAISEATRSKIVGRLGIPADKVRVIDNPILVKRSDPGPFNEHRPTILQIGTAANKNLERLMEAIESLSCRLRIVGRLSLRDRLRIESLGIDLVHNDALDDEEIERAYEEADIVTLCSTDEGFGLPIIEAQAKGKIVVTSEQPPMSDVAGQGARLVDPRNADSIRKGIDEVIADPKLRERLRQTGYENLKRFHPTAIGECYLDLYRSMLEDNQ